MIIAGLGNPGKEYEITRHNAGFWAADAIAGKFHGTFSKKAFQALICDFQFHGARHFLVKPQTYMNLSGEAISAIMLDTETTPEQLLVITDDINLPTGRVRLRASGSDGGHNGLKSIINHIGKGFWRLRIGVGQPVEPGQSQHSQLVDHVLGSISASETQIFEKINRAIPELAALWLMGMGNKAMTSFNGIDFACPDENPEKN
jgi:PTH1 family peptidyl-tRNA hydrolase